MPEPTAPLLKKYLPLLLAALAIATVAPGGFLAFEDSEIWGLTSSRRIIEHPFIGSSAHFKPLFSLLFGTIVSLAPSDWSALILSRWLTLGLAAGGLFSFFSVGLLLTAESRRPSTSIIWYALFCTFPVVLLHLTKVRSDNLATSLVLISALIILLCERQPQWLRGLVYFLSSAAALLITMKSIDLVASLAVIFWISERENKDGPSQQSPQAVSPFSINKKLAHRLWLFSPLIALLSASLFITSEFTVRSFFYWIDSYKDLSPFDAAMWIQLSDTLVSGPVVGLILVSAFAIGLLQMKKLARQERALLTIGIISLFFMLIHSQKYYFFIASRAPFLALGAIPGLHIICECLAKRWSNQTITRALGLAFFLAVTMTARLFSHHGGFYLGYQKAVHKSLADYLARSNTEKYWDAIGIFPKRNTVFHYPSPGDRTNHELLQFVSIAAPTMILRTEKMEILEPELSSWLQIGYVALSPSIYIRSSELAIPANCKISAAQIRMQMKQNELRLPAALVMKSDVQPRWARQPFQILDGSTTSSAKAIDTKIPDETEIELPDCYGSSVVYGITEALPWDALPAPVFTPFFGYVGKL